LCKETHLLIVNGLAFTLLGRRVRSLGVGHIFQGRHIFVEVIVLLLALGLKNALGARGTSSTRTGRTLHLGISILICVFRSKALGELVGVALASAAADRAYYMCKIQRVNDNAKCEWDLPLEAA
jgi:hypothetical protein